jgi:hypothetical protein
LALKPVNALVADRASIHSLLQPPRYHPFLRIERSVTTSLAVLDDPCHQLSAEMSCTVVTLALMHHYKRKCDGSSAA